MQAATLPPWLAAAPPRPAWKAPVAAALARDGGARRLWLTHFGPSLENPFAYLSRATAIFPGAVVGRDGLKETLAFEEE